MALVLALYYRRIMSNCALGEWYAISLFIVNFVPSLWLETLMQRLDASESVFASNVFAKNTQPYNDEAMMALTMLRLTIHTYSAIMLCIPWWIVAIPSAVGIGIQLSLFCSSSNSMLIQLVCMKLLPLMVTYVYERCFVSKFATIKPPPRDEDVAAIVKTQAKMSGITPMRALLICVCIVMLCYGKAATSASMH